MYLPTKLILSSSLQQTVLVPPTTSWKIRRASMEMSEISSLSSSLSGYSLVTPTQPHPLLQLRSLVVGNAKAPVMVPTAIERRDHSRQDKKNHLDSPVSESFHDEQPRCADLPVATPGRPTRLLLVVFSVFSFCYRLRCLLSCTSFCTFSPEL